MTDPSSEITDPAAASSANSAQPLFGRGGRFGKKTASSAVVLVLLGIYTFARPLINDRLGWNLPAINNQDRASETRGTDVSARPTSQSQTDRSGSQAGSGSQADRSGGNSTKPASSANRKPKGDAKAGDSKAGTQTASPKSPSSQAKPGADELAKPAANTKPSGGPLSSRMRSRSSDTSKSPTQSNTSPRGPPSNAGDADLLYGLLREIGKDRFMSPEGLLYLPGSAEGHRLEHLRRHTEDQPSRPGSHGVFDKGMEGALATIDRAYSRAKKGSRTTKKVDRGRTIYTVDMGARVGYVGGRDGNRRRKPMARRVVLVLEGKNVITAYPK